MKAKGFVGLSVIALSVFLMAGSAGASLVNNGGFEDGLDNWTVYGNAYTVTDAVMGGQTFNPKEGLAMAQIVLPETGGFVMDNVLSQNITAEKGQYLNLSYNFWTYDEGEYDRFVILIDGEDVLSLPSSLAGGDEECGTLDSTGWKDISIILPKYSREGDISVSLALTVGNTGDNEYHSGVFLDEISLSSDPLGDEVVNPIVPIPATVWLLGGGLVGLVGMRKRFTDHSASGMA